MAFPSFPDPADELDAVAAALEWTLHRDDWWGPARRAYDAELTILRDEARQIADELRTTL